jgi:hypothetical protein
VLLARRHFFLNLFKGKTIKNIDLEGKATTVQESDSKKLDTKSEKTVEAPAASNEDIDLDNNDKIVTFTKKIEYAPTIFQLYRDFIEYEIENRKTPASVPQLAQASSEFLQEDIQSPLEMLQRKIREAEAIDPIDKVDIPKERKEVRSFNRFNQVYGTNRHF